MSKDPRRSEQRSRSSPGSGLSATSPTLRSVPLLTRRPGQDQLEGRNVIVEALRAGRELSEILLDLGAEPRGSLVELLALAEQAGTTVSRVPRQVLDRLTLTGTHQGAMAWARPGPPLGLKELLERLSGQDRSPFLLLLDQVQYEQNLGAILRTAEAAGVHGAIIPRSHSAQITPLVRRISAGATEHLPVVRESTMSALKVLRRSGLLIVGADEHAPCAFDEVELSGPLALVMGGEHKGLSPPVRERCDRLVSLPMRGRIPSLNVSVAAALLMYEKVRQERSLARREGV